MTNIGHEEHSVNPDFNLAEWIQRTQIRLAADIKAAEEMRPGELSSIDKRREFGTYVAGLLGESQLLANLVKNYYQA